MGNVAEIQQAFAMANQANLSREELEELEHQAMFIQDQRGAIIKATQQGIEQGIQQGIEQGIEQGIQQGIEQGVQQGRQATQLEIARQLLPMLEDEAIATTTGLPISEIEALRQQGGL
jgi:predicted transposase/invertase (TIGR01784 family)